MALLASFGTAAAPAQVTGEATGLTPSAVACRNLTTGQRVISMSGVTEWDCAALGLEFEAGDRVETQVRGLLPAALGDTLEAPLVELPEDFVSHVTDDVTMGGGRARVGDLDADGDLDFVASNQFFWYENLGGLEPVFTKHFLDGPESVAFADELIDVDRNGRLDIVASFGLNSDKLIWFRNRGDSPTTFAKQTIAVFPGWAMLQIADGDLDGDGDTDLFAQLAADECCDEQFVWLENTGTGFTRHLILEEFGGAGKILALDADGDDDLDLIRSDFLDATVSWIENEGGGAFGEERLIDQAEVLFLRSGDIDGDGDPDIVTYDRNAEELRWYETRGTGDFVVHTVGVFPGRGLDGLAVGGFSSNGREDILIGNSTSPLTRLENRGGSPPTFVEHTVEVEQGASAPVVGDIDGDGRLDLVVTEVLCWSWLENRIGLRLTVTGLGVRAYSCRNRTTAQMVRVQTTDAAIDCESEGLVVSPGDEIEVVVRGVAE